MLPVTAQAHDIVRQVVRPGDVVIDATAGNGHDTRFLARLVGSGGAVYAIDLQHAALQQAQALLHAEQLGHVTWQVGNHARLAELIPEGLHGQIAVVMFNLGYLPGGNKTITTTSEATSAAVQAALALLRPGGVVTIVAYSGHPGGAEEVRALEELLAGLSPAMFRVERGPIDPVKVHPPRLYAIWKTNDAESP